jgi:hypothetical protein
MYGTRFVVGLPPYSLPTSPEPLYVLTGNGNLRHNHAPALYHPTLSLPAEPAGHFPPNASSTPLSISCHSSNQLSKGVNV